MRVQLRALFSGIALALIVAVPPATAIDGQNARLAFEYFADSDNVHVYSTGGDYGVDFAANRRLSLAWNHELVVVPGVSAPAGSDEALDSISGASRPIGSTSDPYSDWTKTRDQLNVVGTWAWSSLGYYVSNESDYFAQMVHGGLERRMFNENTLFRLAGSYGWDEIQPDEDDDTATAPDTKNTLHLSAVLTQVLTPTTVVQLGAELAQVDGLQHNPYRTVYVDGAYVTELHPDQRSRQDVYLKVNQYLPNRSSLKVDYKLYTDDWGVSSHTIGGKINQYVGGDVVMRYRYRYYSQTNAEFWRSEYTEPVGPGGYRTADYRLGDFTAHLFGAKLTWDLSGSALAARWFRGTSLNLKFERYFNSNNFSANIFESGLAFAF